MGRVVRVDWVDLAKVDEEFLNQAVEFKTINEELQKQFESLQNCWNGIDSNNFIANSKNVNSALTKEVKHLADWCEYIKKSSGKYNRVVDEGLASLKQSEGYYE